MRKRFAVICLLSLGLFGCPSDDRAPQATPPAAETNKAPAAEAPKPAAEAQQEAAAAQAAPAPAPAPAK